MATESYDENDGVRERCVKLWDVATSQSVATLLRGLDSAFTQLEFNPNGKTVAYSDEKRVRIWDAATGTHIFTLSNPRGRISSIQFNLLGTKLAAGDGVRILAQ